MITWLDEIVNTIIFYIFYKDVLTVEPLLTRLHEQDLNLLIATAKQLRKKKGQIIFLEGRPADYLYFIQQGEIRVFKKMKYNREITIFTRGKDDGFGEIGIFSSENYSNSAIAVSDSVILSIHKEVIESILASNGALCLQFMKWVAESLEASTAQARDFLAFGSEGAIASVFLRYVNMHGTVTTEGVRIMKPVMIQDISKYIGISRETVSRIVNNWKQKGIIDNDNKYFLVKNIDYLQSMLGCEDCGVKHCVL